MPRWVKRVLKGLAVYIVISVALATLMAELTLHPMRLAPPDGNRIAALYQPYGARLEEVSITAVDGAELRAWYSVPQRQNGRAVVLLHGIGDNRGGVAGYGQGFLQEGYRILLPDSRAHGQSGGTMATYGLRETDDIHRWVGWLYSQGASCVDGFGESMGAALVLESLAGQSGFCAVVADSSFSTFRSVAYDREGFFLCSGCLGLEGVIGRTIGLLPAEIALLYARRRYGVDLLRANPLDAVKQSPVPVLLIHGSKDVNVLPWHSRLLAQANLAHVQLWIVPGARHGGAVVAARDEFWWRVLNFFAQHDGGSSGP